MTAGVEQGFSTSCIPRGGQAEGRRHCWSLRSESAATLGAEPGSAGEPLGTGHSPDLGARASGEPSWAGVLGDLCDSPHTASPVLTQPLSSRLRVQGMFAPGAPGWL